MDAKTVETGVGMSAQPAPKRSRGRPPLGPEHKERLIASALKLLDEQGEAGLQARLIAADAGISVGSLYKLIGDIDDVTREVALRSYEEVAEEIVKALSKVQNASAREKIMVASMAYLSFIEKHYYRWSTILSRVKNKYDWPEWFEGSMSSGFGLISDILSELPGEYSDEELLVASYTIWASVHGVVTSAPENFKGVVTMKSMLELLINSIMSELEAKGS